MKVLLHVGGAPWPGYFELYRGFVPEGTEWFRTNTEYIVEDLWSLARRVCKPRCSDDGFCEGSEVAWVRMRALTDLLSKAEPPSGEWRLAEWAYPFAVASAFAVSKHLPDCAVLYNPYESPGYILDRICEHLGIPRLFFEKGPLPRSFALDTKGMNAGSSFASESTRSPRPQARIHRDLELLRKEIFGTGKTGWKQSVDRVGTGALRQRLCIGDKVRVILYVGQLNRDSNISMFSPFFQSNAEALRFLVGLIRPGDDVFILAKKHPYGEDDDDAIRKLLGSAGCCTSEVHLHDCLDLADVVVSINSSVVFDALLLHTPTVLLGKGLFNGKQVALEYNGENEADVRTFIEGVGPRLEEKTIDYWCWRGAFEWLFRCRDSDIAPESRRACRLIERVGEQRPGYSEDRARDALVDILSMSWKAFERVSAERDACKRALQSIRNKPPVRLYRAVKRRVRLFFGPRDAHRAAKPSDKA